ncbi:MAG TPA: aldehyde dehydrogenase family protein, partial [Mycobacteriales bacterium]
MSTTATHAPTRPGTFDSLHPATGEVVGTYPVHTADDVAAAVARAREAATWWAAQGPAGRRKVLEQWKGVLTRRAPQLADVMHRETGKP